MSDNYYNQETVQLPNKGLGIASLVCGILAVLFGFCTGFGGILLGIPALLLGIFSKGKAPKRPATGISGIVTGVLGMAIGFFMIGLSIWLVTNNPEFMSSYSSIMDFYNK